MTGVADDMGSALGDAREEGCHGAKQLLLYRLPPSFRHTSTWKGGQAVKHVHGC